jgi:hypothetical protein
LSVTASNTGAPLQGRLSVGYVISFAGCTDYVGGYVRIELRLGQLSASNTGGRSR